MVKLGKTERRLLENSSKAMDNAHVLWGFEVGATVIGEDGETYNGFNVESWVLGLGCVLRDVLLTTLFCTAAGKFWR